MKKEPLSEYDAKRSFEQTPEPPSNLPAERTGPLLFVVQKHDATRLHYDFRLELDGVLKSWAVPKGFSYSTDDKHMAVMVEDHPFDYGSFEGVIPSGQYGAGEVIVWDCGTYWSDEENKLPPKTREEAEEEIRKGLEIGKLGLCLRGTKLKGSWALVKMKSANDWLLIKHRDRYTNTKPDILDEGDSVLSGLSIADIERGHAPKTRLDSANLVPVGKPEGMPKKPEPMLASVAEQPFDDPNYVFEPKLDGVRVLACIEGGEVKLLSRNGLDISSQFPAIRESLKEQYSRGMLLDGEVVAFDEGRPSFNGMLKRLHLKDEAALLQMDRTIPCVFYVFDLLHFEGANLRALPLRTRRRYLEQALFPTDLVQLVSQVQEDGLALYQAVLRTGLEGVVAKKAASVYEMGRRSKYWLKVKHSQTAEFVVGGFSQGSGDRADTFGAILVGYFSEGELIYSGHVGSGFNDESLPALRTELESLVIDQNPFSEKPLMNNPVTWVKPQIVVEVKFQEVTPAGMLRAPVFLRVREDASASTIGPIPRPVHLGSESGALPSEPNSAERDPKPEIRSTKSGAMIDSILEQLDNKTENLKLELGGHQVGLSNLNKELWPANPELKLEPFTKRDLLRYLAKVSDYMIPHLADRPLTLIRFPEGIHGQKFFQKHWEQKKPDFVESVTLYSESNKENQTYLMANNLPTLIWLGQLGTLEFHVWGSRCVGGPDAQGLGADFIDSEENIDRSVLNYPDFIKFDLDPYVYSGKEAAGDEPELNRDGFEKGKTVAYWLKQLLDSMGLASFVKTTGKTGLHIFVPIVRDLDYEAVRDISGAVCRGLEIDHPKEITTEWNTKKRTGKIFMDFNMNVRAKTLNSPYSPRALPNQSISMPLTWDDLRDAYPTDFLMRDVPELLTARGDVWSKILEAKKDMGATLGK